MNEIKILDDTHFAVYVPALDFTLNVYASPESNPDGDIHYRCVANGHLNDQPVSFEEYWFKTIEAMQDSLRRREPAFFNALLSPEAMHQMEVDSFSHLPEA